MSCKSPVQQTAMPVTVVPAAHEPKQHPATAAANSLKEFLTSSCSGSPAPYELEIRCSSFKESGDLLPSSNSFIRSAIEAWGRHSHLVIRPDDMWFAILVQMNFFMERNAEKLRHMFVHM